ncbi:MAG: CDP-diacylglycerol--glycerol-3-phosphate 3-phosphatidyltransferase [Acutalibacteraceae bacterium]
MKEKKKINLPNRLTILRMVLTPFLVYFMLTDWRFSPLLSFIIFAAASITDFIDGKIARDRNLVTDFGKFLDPIADKIVVLSILICMITKGLCSPVVVVIVIFREFIVSSLRLLAATNSVVLAAEKSGKVKTAFQMLSVTLVLALCSVQSLFGAEIPVKTISNILMWITAALTLYSGVEYIVRNRQYINPFE